MRVGRYLIGTEVQQKSGRILKKIKDIDGIRWESRNRLNFMKAYKRELKDNERVYHISEDKTDDNPKNLVAISFSKTRYKLAHSIVIWEPRKILTTKS